MKLKILFIVKYFTVVSSGGFDGQRTQREFLPVRVKSEAPSLFAGLRGKVVEKSRKEYQVCFDICPICPGRRPKTCKSHRVVKPFLELADSKHSVGGFIGLAPQESSSSSDENSDEGKAESEKE